MSSQQPGHELVIGYCEPCGDRRLALDLARSVLDQWATELASLTLRPGEDVRFVVTLDGATVFTGADGAQGAQPGEITAALEARLGPPPGFGA